MLVLLHETEKISIERRFQKSNFYSCYSHGYTKILYHTNFEITPF